MMIIIIIMIIVVVVVITTGLDQGRQGLPQGRGRGHPGGPQ